jgi:trans-aconitate methyltransferase
MDKRERIEPCSARLYAKLPRVGHEERDDVTADLACGPGSALTRWFNRRFAVADNRMRRAGIVALALQHPARTVDGNITITSAGPRASVH